MNRKFYDLIAVNSFKHAFGPLVPNIVASSLSRGLARLARHTSKPLLPDDEIPLGSLLHMFEYKNRVWSVVFYLNVENKWVHYNQRNCVLNHGDYKNGLPAVKYYENPHLYVYVGNRLTEIF